MQEEREKEEDKEALNKAKELLIQAKRTKDPEQKKELQEKVASIFPDLLKNINRYTTRIYSRTFMEIGDKVYDFDKGSLWKMNATEINPNQFRCIGEKIPVSSIPDFPTLEATLSSLYSDRPFNFPSLRGAIERFTNEQQKIDPSWDFYKNLLPDILSWANDHSQLPLLTPQESGQNSKDIFTPLQVRCILANSFLLNTRDLAFLFGIKNRMIGTLDFADIYQTDSTISIERILCQLCYFDQVKSLDPADERRIIFERKAYEVPKADFWINDKTPIVPDQVKFSVSGMEISKAPYFVDFANMDLHIGCIIPSMTQEEVLFSTSPECFLGLLIAERHQANEVMCISNVRRYSHYTGYASHFRWKGKFGYPRIFNVLVMDACMGSQFAPKNLLRDLGKCLASFQFCSKDLAHVSTGHWGCGAFGGNPFLKMIQQTMAATVAGVRLDYSVFGNASQCEKFQKIYRLICEKGLCVADLWRMIEPVGVGEYQMSDTFEKNLNILFHSPLKRRLDP